MKTRPNADAPIEQIPVTRLEKSPLNARKTISKSGIDEMKASIMAHGLMQNLVVTAGPKNMFHVVAGSRRLAALQALQAEGKLPKDHVVPCQIVSEDDALELSIAENTIRHAMHPADEFEAFAKLISEGKTAEQTSQRFGVTEKHVLQRLKLARVAPKLLAEYRAGKITLEMLEAFTITDDHKRQLAVYKDMRGWDDPSDIRDALTEKLLRADDPMALLVGLDAYHAAGGKSRSDLFGEDVFLENPDLAKKLATEKLETAKTKLIAEGWAWVEVNPERDYQFIYRCEHIYPGKGGKFTADQIKSAGVYVSIDREGKLHMEKGLIRPEDKKRIAKEKAVASGSPKVETADVSQALRRDLEVYRLGAAQAEIAKHPEIAYEFLVFKLALDQLEPMNRIEDGTSISSRHEYRGGIPSDDARKFSETQLAAAKKNLPLDWMKPKNEAERFQQFRQLTSADKQRLLAYCVAATLKPKLPDEEVTAYDVALSLTGGDVASYWRPTKDNYLSRITREQLLGIGESVMPDGKKWAKDNVNAKKGALVDQLHATFAVSGKPDTRDAIKNWLPEGMAFNLPEKKKKQAA